MERVVRVMALSFEAPVDDFDDDILLLRGHLVVAGEAQAPLEQVRAHVRLVLLDVGVGPAPAVPFPRDEGVGAVDGLHVHGLPQGPAFRPEGCQRFQDLRGGEFPGFGMIQHVPVAPDLGRHGLGVDQQAGQPVVRDGLCFVKGVHGNGEILEAFFVSFIDGLLLGDVVVQVRDLAPNHAGYDVRHAVVVADLFMLIPWRFLPALGGPFPDLVRVLLGVRQEHASGGTGNDLVAVEGNAVIVSQGAGLGPGAVQQVFRPQAFGRVLDDEGAVPVCDFSDFLHFARGAVEVGQDDQLRVRIDFKGLCQGFRVHVPGVRLRVNEHGVAVLIRYGVDGGVKGHVRAENPFPLQGAFVGLCLAVELFPGQLRGQVQGGGAGGQAHGVFHAYVFGDLLFRLVDVLAHRGDPVGLDRAVHPSLLVPVHGGGRQPDPGREGFQSFKTRIGLNVDHIAALLSQKKLTSSPVSSLCCCAQAS